MSVIEFYAGDRLRRLTLHAPNTLGDASINGITTDLFSTTVGEASTIKHARSRQSASIDAFSHGIDECPRLVSFSKSDESAVIPTATLIVEGASKGYLKKLKAEFGLRVIEEGTYGKVHLSVPERGEAGIKQASVVAKQAFESGNVVAAHPNFIRVLKRIAPSAAVGSPLWNHMNEGNPGVPGADVAARAAWLITKGRGEVRVAVLDEGVDTNHPALKATVVSEQDFVDGNTTSQPHGNDAHGTACAGIIFSRDWNTPGLASLCSLVSIRIARGDGYDGWVFDDFKTADAIDWAWDQGKADVLSNSWGGGPMVDIITRAFDRARRRGRNGKGCVVVVAAGNNDGRIQFPASLPNVMAVGASNQWDERKSKSPISKDGESNWGSCYGKGLSLLAPGVSIATTDIQGAAGYGPDDFFMSFNGTSSATPHVAAAAALILSVAPGLSEEHVRRIITQSADRLSSDGKRDKFFGWGRLNIFSALRLALRR